MEPQRSSTGLIVGIIVVIIIIIVVGLVWANSNSNDNTPADTNIDVNLPVSNTTDTTPPASTGTSTGASTAPMTANVLYNGVNFSPASVEIRQGGTVTFTNTSSGTMWVASAPHPSHTIYPEFDQKASVGNGGMYSFTFTKVGEWKYHNHMNPTAFGTIVVK